jgi:aminopeptidase N
MQFGNNAYGKPATALNILRETIMGRELFDYAFKVYANRWKFAPNPEDFRTMEDASAVDLDWFFRGWFYSTDFVDIGINDVKYYVSETASEDLKTQK